jgi:hypothetical protein
MTTPTLTRAIERALEPTHPDGARFVTLSTVAGTPLLRVTERWDTPDGDPAEVSQALLLPDTLEHPLTATRVDEILHNLDRVIRRRSTL